MNNYCVCGRKIDTTSCSPWISVTYDNKGNVLEGTCVHGIYFGRVEKEPLQRRPNESDGGITMGMLTGFIWGIVLGIIFTTLGIKNYMCIWQYWIALVLPIVMFMWAGFRISK